MYKKKKKSISNSDVYYFSFSQIIQEMLWLDLRNKLQSFIFISLADYNISEKNQIHNFYLLKGCEGDFSIYYYLKVILS